MIPLPDLSTDEAMELALTQVPFLGQGTRKVYDLGDGLVLKWWARHFGWGSKANLDEAEVWSCVKRTALAQLFLPVRACHPDGHWLLMDKADEVGADADAESVRTSMETLGCEVRINLSDLHRNNLGRRNGQLVILDYGACSVAA